MTPEPVSVADLLDEVEYDFWGAIFRLREITRTVGKRYGDVLLELAELERRAQSGEDVEANEIVAKWCEGLDVLLEFTEWADEPEEGERRPKRPTVKQILLPKWKKDEVGEDRIEAIFDHIRGEVERRKRPTSTRMTDY